MTFVIFKLLMFVLEVRKYSVTNVLILQVGKPEFGPQKRHRQNQGMVVYIWNLSTGEAKETGLLSLFLASLA